MTSHHSRAVSAADSALFTDQWVTRRRVEVVTTKNIETRVQRQLLLEDGKVLEDSGPIISTDTTVDTTEKKDENTEVSRGSLVEGERVDACLFHWDVC